MKKNIAIALTAPAAALALALGAAGCGGPGGAAQSSAAQPQSAQDALHLERGWVKAAGKGQMTAVFGTLSNDSASAITVTGAATDAAGMVQLHETSTDSSGGTTMQEKKGGFKVPGQGVYELKPGGDHIMLMKLGKALKPGAQIDLTLQTSAGEAKLTVGAKDFAGAQEEYGGASPSDASGAATQMSDMPGMKSDAGHASEGAHEGHSHG
ncbi:copper chaperone PCu(A)C [Brevibacterium sp. 5221]|uniref:Copper chaperone PCu(A)C n=1 Tax=Brevibacterium rongguiense TaxID=2695267 RepID=A0A6N9H9E3_9MICO|nr:MULTISPECIES: copper chaperone PCu(A)C [Brevibacterium]MYM20451.1 copper chaperone PCu(A)C [Brevibacterium rongguiense]WAL39686.1 copper chaperone PCu(A)C [Brevibacterium sp. BRM-1]